MSGMVYLLLTADFVAVSCKHEAMVTCLGSDLIVRLIQIHKHTQQKQKYMMMLVLTSSLLNLQSFSIAPNASFTWLHPSRHIMATLTYSNSCMVLISSFLLYRFAYPCSKQATEWSLSGEAVVVKGLNDQVSSPQVVKLRADLYSRLNPGKVVVEAIDDGGHEGLILSLNPLWNGLRQ